jgi:Nin one binding (NOB1) Zn-ribbon like
MRHRNDGLLQGLASSECIDYVGGCSAAPELGCDLAAGLYLPQSRHATSPDAGCAVGAQEAGRLFCPQCGNATMEKVEVTTGPDGAEQYGIRKKHNLRGTRYSLPKPKVGTSRVGTNARRPFELQLALRGMASMQRGRQSRALRLREKVQLLVLLLCCNPVGSSPVKDCFAGWAAGRRGGAAGGCDAAADAAHARAGRQVRC